MKDLINSVKTNYLKLTNRVNELTAKEKELNIIGADIYNRFEEVDNDVIDIRNKCRDKENEIIKKKNKYIFKRHKRHVFAVMGIVCAICAVITGINYSIITNKFLAAIGCLGISWLAGSADIVLFWDKLTPIYKSKFDALESTKILNDELKKLYDIKIEKEKILEEIQKELSEHSILLNSVLDEKSKIQEQIRQLKESSFERIFVDTDVYDLDKPMELKRK